MFIRISLIVAILAAIAAGTLSILKVREEITTLQGQRDGYHTQRDTVQNQLNGTNKILVATQKTLKDTQADLADTKTQLASQTKIAADAVKKADDLNVKLTKANQDRDAAQNELGAYKATLLTPEAITKLDNRLKSAQMEIGVMKDENTVLEREKNRLQTRLQKYEGTNYIVTLPAGLRGKILTVDPKWDFVVLNVGEDQGIVQDGELLVSRDGKLVAKVVVTSAQKDRCIANLVPGWKLGEMFEGDEVTPAHPAS